MVEPLRWRVGFCVAAIGVAFMGTPAKNRAAADEPVNFNRDVRSILSANCFFCHGPDDKHREAELRLDTEEGIRAVFAGVDLNKNEAWSRINSSDPDEKMPPPSSHKHLLADDIETLRRWIEQGAPWQGHWAFIPPQRPLVPEVAGAARVVNPIDAFVINRLQREGRQPGEPADRERLLRRVTFDLTGLPPTIEEIDHFVNDQSPSAFEAVVDRLLASERYGERMALAWMDAARYGDSSVFHADGPRDMWPWRDWVIRAYNSNMPFDQFTIEQIAGDLLPEATFEQKCATGFNRNNATTDEGGAIAEEYRVEYAVDRVKTTSMVWLGLTMECAQCHDHKYDPISQTDYYRFFAYFNQAADPGMQTRGGNQSPVADIPDVQKLAQLGGLEKQAADLQARLTARAEASDSDFQSWLAKAESEKSESAAMPGGMLVHFRLDEAAGAESADAVAADRKAKVQGKPLWAEGKFGGAFQCDGSNFVDLGDQGNFERDEAFSYGAWLKPVGVGSGAAIARMDDGGGYRGYDLYCNGGHVSVHIINSWPTNAIKVTTKAKLAKDAWQHVLVTYDGTSKAAGIKIYFDGKPQDWNIEQDGLRDTIRTSKTLYLGRRNPGSPYKGLIDDVRLFGRELTPIEVATLAGSDPLAPILALPAADRSADQVTSLREFYLHSLDEPYQSIEKELAEVKKSISEANKPISTVMVMQDVPQPRMTYVLDRGNYASPNKERPVEPATLSFLPPLPDAEENRLGMARWLTSPQHPLTARVAVNRYWYMLFGTGLVKTVEDFGSQGDWPSHPDLLDWLAVDFVESGWNVKRMLKQIVMSSTYRQSSQANAELVRADPENRLLARGPRFRLQAEMVRDNALAAGGLLVGSIGGPSVKPYQPPGLWNEVSLSGERFTQDHGENLYRRSMYTYWKRSSPAPSLTIFDAPSRESCVVRRSRTNTPLQALVTLNDPQYLEAARALAERALRDGGPTLEARITYAHRLATGIHPRPATLDILKRAYEEELAVFAADAERAKKLLSAGESPRDEAIDPVEHAALAVVMSIILNLDETVTRG